MNKSICILAIICLFSGSLLATASASPLSAEKNANALFQQGNELYGHGKYEEAIKIYNRIVAEDGFSGPLLFNLGNSYAQTGQIGKAVLSYERALRLSPGDSDVRGNLDLIRKNQGLFQEKLPLDQRVASIMDLNQWTLLAGLALVALTFISVASLRLTNGRQVQRLLTGICLVALLLGVTGIFLEYRQLDEAVVVGGEVPLLLSPFSGSSPAGTIQEGRIVRSLSTHGRYSLVEDRTGRSGWVETEAIEPIIGRGGK